MHPPDHLDKRLRPDTGSLHNGCTSAWQFSQSTILWTCMGISRRCVRKARRLADYPAHEVRAGAKPQDGQTARPQRAARSADVGYWHKASVCAVHGHVRSLPPGSASKPTNAASRRNGRSTRSTKNAGCASRVSGPRWRRKQRSVRQVGTPSRISKRLNLLS